MVRSSLSVIPIYVNRLNSPIKKHRVAEWIKKNKIQLYAIHKGLTLDLRTHIS